MHESLEPFRFINEIPVAWGDMDAAKHVNNTVYLRYGETSRIEYLRACGMDFDTNGKGVILAEINCKYIFPLTFPDKVLVGTRTILKTVDEYSFWTEQIIVSQTYDRISAILKAKLVYYDFELLKKSLIPVQAIEKIQQFEVT